MKRTLSCLPVLLLTVGALALLNLPSSAHAARYPLGYDWKEWEMGDVSVYYPDGYRDYAQYVAERALVHLDSLNGWYGIRPKQSRIVLNPAHDQGMAFATVMPKRMEISLTPVLDKGLRPQAGFYLDRVTGHELTHVVQFTTQAGITKPARFLFGDAVAPLGIAPDWIVEGQAIWTESRQGGGRLNSPYHRMLFRAPQLEGKLWTLDQISQPGTVAPIANRAYVSGAFLVGNMIEEFKGLERTSRWMRNQAKYVGFQGFAFKKTFSRTAESEYTDLRYTWRDNNRTMLSERSRAGYAVGERILAEKRTSYRHPAWINDHSLVVVDRSYDHSPRLTIVEAAGSKMVTHSLKVGYSADNVVVPVGDGFVYGRMRRGVWGPEETRAVLVYVDEKGRESDLVNGGFEGWSPAWNVASSQLAYICRTDQGGLALRTIKLKEGRVLGSPTTLFETRLGVVADPAWNADGSKIAFTVDMGEREEVVVLTPGASTLSRLRLDDELAAWDPTFSSKGTLWISSAVDTVYDLFELDLEEGTALRRTRCLTGAMEPAVSPNGAFVAYSHYTSDGFSLALLDSSRWTFEPHPLTIDTVSVDSLLASEKGFGEQPVFGVERDYHAWQHAQPIFWMPQYRQTDEDAFGAAVLGRDPLGLLTWRLAAFQGSQSGLPLIDGTVTWRGLPVDVSGRLARTPEQYRWLERDPASPGDAPTFRSREEWQPLHDFSLLAHQSFRHDRGPWSATLTPFAGWTGSEHARFVRRTNQFDIEPTWFQGARGGVDWYAVNSASRDPIPSRFIRVTLSGQKDVPGAGDLEGKLFETSVRWHHPLFMKNTVLQLGADTQTQDGDVSFSRSRILPRGMIEDSLSTVVKVDGHMAKLTASVHAPLWFLDRGLGMGWAFLSRIDAALFVDATTGWGHSLPIGDAIDQHLYTSYGAELSFGGWLFYEAGMQLRVGYAMLNHEGSSKQGVVYLGTSLPLLPGIQVEAPRRY
ncbi:hypothetical protein KQI63_07435 [bacterium]|nr:hypothetical protein [bacterium]